MYFFSLLVSNILDREHDRLLQLQINNFSSKSLSVSADSEALCHLRIILSNQAYVNIHKDEYIK